MGNGLCVETSSSWTVFDWLDKVLGNIGSYAGTIRLRNDDDFADRLSHHYTTIILVVFTVVVSTKQYVGDTIQCWCPAQFTPAHVQYTNQVCWVSNTYYIPMEAVIPSGDGPKREGELTYYQWVPMILLFMALMFKIPRIMWKALTASTAVDLNKRLTSRAVPFRSKPDTAVNKTILFNSLTVISMTYDLQLAPAAERAVKVDDITDYLMEWLDTARQYRTDCCVGLRDKLSAYSCVVCGRRYGNYFMTVAMATKVMYVSNAIVQFFALNSFLGTEFSMFGFQAMGGLATDEPAYIKESPRFPRVTLCDFQIRQMQNVQRWTVQCVLPINLFNEKIFLFIWFWLLFLVVCSTATLCASFYAIMFPVRRIAWITKYLKMRKAYNVADRRLVGKFVTSYLKFDGVYVLRVVSRNSTEIVVNQIVEVLWIKYRRRYCAQKFSNNVGHCDVEIYSEGEFRT